MGWSASRLGLQKAALEEKGRCVQSIVATRVERAAVKRVAAALGDHVDLCTTVAANIGAGDTGLHTELLNRVSHIEQVKRPIDLRVVVADAIEGVIVRLAAHACNRKCGDLRAGCARDGSGSKQSQTQKITVEERQALNRSRVDGV